MTMREKAAALRVGDAFDEGAVAETLRAVVELLSAGPGNAATETALSLLRGLDADLPTAPPPSGGRRGIGFDAAALCGRVDTLVRTRREAEREAEQADGFRWESDAAGVICWVDGAPRAALIGRSILASGALPRAAFRNLDFDVPGEGPVAGKWQLSGVPFFDSAHERFSGFRGSARRAAVAPSLVGSNEPDLVRQLVHELRTPLNAILGFAGMIEGEYLGPAGVQDRARAGRIGEEAKRVLAVVDEMDRQARAGSSR